MSRELGVGEVTGDGEVRDAWASCKCNRVPREYSR